MVYRLAAFAGTEIQRIRIRASLEERAWGDDEKWSIVLEQNGRSKRKKAPSHFNSISALARVLCVASLDATTITSTTFKECEIDMIDDS